MNDIDMTFAALAEPTRRRVVEVLRERPLRAGEIAARLGVGRPAMSRHLRALLSSGLVDVELSTEDLRARRYRLRAERFVALQAWLSELDGDKTIVPPKRPPPRWAIGSTMTSTMWTRFPGATPPSPSEASHGIS